MDLRYTNPEDEEVKEEPLVKPALLTSVKNILFLRSNVSKILATFLILPLIAITVYVSQQRQTLQQHAASSNSLSPSITSVSATCSGTTPVVTLNIAPPSNRTDAAWYFLYRNTADPSTWPGYSQCIADPNCRYDAPFTHDVNNYYVGSSSTTPGQSITMTDNGSGPAGQPQSNTIYNYVAACAVSQGGDRGCKLSAPQSVTTPNCNPPTPTPTTAATPTPTTGGTPTPTTTSATVSPPIITSALGACVKDATSEHYIPAIILQYTPSSSSNIAWYHLNRALSANFSDLGSTYLGSFPVSNGQNPTIADSTSLPSSNIQLNTHYYYVLRAEQTSNTGPTSAISNVVDATTPASCSTSVNPVCNSDSDCPAGQKCITPPQPTCPSGQLCPASAPRPYCSAAGTSLTLTLKLPGIGNNTGENSKPLHTTRNVTVELGSIAAIGATNGQLTYSPSSGMFTGTVSINTDPYSNVFVTVPGYLRKKIPASVMLYGKADQTSQKIQENTLSLQQVTLSAGDINGDNKLDILDYQLFSSCWQAAITETPNPTCDPNIQTLSDLNDDGTVDATDYKIFFNSIFSKNGD